MTNRISKVIQNGTEYNIGWVDSVNNQTWAVTVSEFSPWWTATTWYVVTKTAGGYEWADIPVKSVNGQTGDVSVWDIKYSDFYLKMSSWWATLTISDLFKQFTPNQNFTLVSGTVKEWMQYVVRINSGATVRTMTLWSWVTNPFNEDLTLTANKKTTIILLATSTSTLEIFGVRTAV